MEGSTTGERDNPQLPWENASHPGRGVSGLYIRSSAVGFFHHGVFAPEPNCV